MKLTLQQVQAFLASHSSEPADNVVPLSGGEWSQAFGFRQAGHDLVIRFGEQGDDYLKDQFAARYGSAVLPIPKVLEVGETPGGYYAISERAFGTMLDALDKPAMRQVMPSLFTTMDTIRQTDISHTAGYGPLQPDGSGKHVSWYAALMYVATDEPSMKAAGWHEGLAGSPVGMGPFEEAYAILTELARDLPEVRALAHNDLLNYNVLVTDGRITAIFDWANALYGDFLYDLAQFTFWEPIYEPVRGIDWETAALEHYREIGLDVPEFKRRLVCCMVNMGLSSLVYYGYRRDWTYLEPVVDQTLALAGAAMRQ